MAKHNIKSQVTAAIKVWSRVRLIKYLPVTKEKLNIIYPTVTRAGAA